MEIPLEKVLPLCINNGVWDIENGTILKIAEGKLIT
jgi:hypothetical protein